MTKTVLRFGVFSGLTSAALMFATLPFIEAIGFDNGVYVGYTGMLISFLFIYFGVRAYRDARPGGGLTFARGFNIGILITVLSSLFYVAAWLLVYYLFMPDFGDKYGAHIVEGIRAKGGSAAEIDEAIAQAASMKQMLANPLVNAAVAFTEPFPVGLIVTVISAAVLRRPDAR